MTRQDLTHLYLIVDRSGSISSCLADMEGGLNAFVAEQAKVPGECRVSLTQFDNTIDAVFWDQPISSVGHLSIVPRGSTAMLDAIGRTMAEAGQRLAALAESQRPAAVIVCVVTDGIENASREYDAEMIRKVITEQQQKYSWLVQFVGANMDAALVGGNLGVPRGQTLTFDTAHAGAAYNAMSKSAAAYRGSTAAGESYAVAAAAAAFDEDDEAAAQGRGDKGSSGSVSVVTAVKKPKLP